MTRKDFERWERMRQGGRKSFIWMQGVLGFGLVMGVVTGVLVTVLIMLVRGGSFDMNFLMRQLLLHMLIFPLGGYAWGAWVWSRTEKQYQQEKPRFARAAAGE